MKTKAGVPILIPDKTDFKTKAIIREKRHFTTIKRSLQQEDITLVNTFVPNIKAPKCIKQIMIDSSTITVRYFNTPLLSMGRSSREKINKKTALLNYTLDQMNLMRFF